MLEAHRAGWGASGRNGGQLGSGFNRSPDALASMIGTDGARAAWAFAEGAKALVRELCDAHGIEARLRSGVVLAAHRRRHVRALHDEAARLADAWGYDQVEPLSREALLARVASPDYHGGTLDRGAGHLDPLALALGLARACEAAGARLFESSEALRIERTRGAWRVVTPAARVRAARVLVACNGYLDDLVPGIGRRVLPINSYVVATAPLGERGTALLPENDAVADTRFVIDYFRLSDDGRLVFGGGESYGYRFPADPARAVRRALVRTFPQLADVPVTHAWGRHARDHAPPAAPGGRAPPRPARHGRLVGPRRGARDRGGARVRPRGGRGPHRARAARVAADARVPGRDAAAPAPAARRDDRGGLARSAVKGS